MQALRHIRTAMSSPRASWIAIGVLFVFSNAAHAATFVVTNTSWSGAGSLPQAIADANAAPGADTIAFNIPGPGPHTITLVLGQLVITDDVTIDGTTQPGFTGTSLIEVSGFFRFRVFRIDGATVLMDSLTITNGHSSFMNNNPNSGNGGGVLNEGDLTLRNVIISENTSDFGSGIFNLGTLTLTECTVTGNSTAADGGGIWSRGDASLTNVTVSDNTAGSEGGGLANQHGTLTLTGSTVSGNVSTNDGGGLINYEGTMTLTNCTVSGNTARRGGAILNDQVFTAAVAALTNCTVTGNFATYYGSGIVNERSTLMLTNSIIASNTGSLADCENAGGTVIDQGFNLIELDHDDCLSEPTSLSGVDPLLGSLADNGGPTQTHALLAGSPASDAGDCAGGTILVDQRGEPRPFGPACDMGAYEGCAIPDPIPDGDVAALIAAIHCANQLPGPDIINLSPGGTYSVTSTDASGLGLPIITTDITINGQEATVQNDGSQAFSIIRIDSAAVMLNDLTVRSAGGYGAISATGDIVIARCAFIDNSMQFGEILAFSGSSLHMSDTLVENNAVGAGSILSAGASSTVISGCTFTENSGGGVINLSGDALLTNCTISENGNSVSVVGTPNALLRHCTISGHEPPAGYQVRGVTLTRSIVANAGSPSVDDTRDIIDAGYNLIEDGTGITDPTSMSGDPGLSVLGDFGGLTPTHGLFCSSPAIDAADCLPGVTNDQRGVARPQGVRCDIGAFEADDCLPCNSIPNPIPDGDVAALIEAIECANLTEGSDIINLAPGGTYEFPSPGSLPTMTTEITINGNGATINRRIVVIDATVTLNDLTVQEAAWAIYATGDITINRCAFIDNRLGGPPGPTLSFSGPSLHMTDTLVSGCTSNRGTMGVYSQDALISGCLFTGNDSNVLDLPESAFVTNCTFSNNRGFFAVSGAPDAVMRHCTIVGHDTGGWVVRGVTLTRSIIAYNSDESSGDTDDIVDGGYNIIEDGSGITDPTSISGDPMLTTLADHGGPTETHGLFCNSPAIDAAPCLPDVTVDQRDVARPQGANCDIGAYEADVCATSCTIPDPIPDGDVNALIDAIDCANARIGADTINLAAGGSYLLTGSDALPTITSEVTINGNGATIRRDSRAYVIQANDAVVTLNDLTVRDSGLAIFASGEITIARCAFVNNRVHPGPHPPILSFQGESLHMSDTLISGNLAFTGIMRVDADSTTISRCLFALNINRPALSLDGDALVTNCTFSDNSDLAVFGTPDAVLRHCTIVGNGFLYQVRGVTLTRSIVAYGASNELFGEAHEIIDAGYNIIEDGSGITDPTSMSGDPMLTTRGDYGGRYPTHALLCNSPAIDAAPCLPDVTIDQRGVARPQGASCDIGAFEADACITPCTIPNPIPDGDAAALIDAINCSNLTESTETIHLAIGGTYTLTAVDNDTDGPNGLPSITDAVVIDGHGATIQRSDASGTPPFRLLHLERDHDACDFELRNLTIRNGDAGDAPGGGLYAARGSSASTNSPLYISNCRIVDNVTSQTGGGMFLAEEASAYLSESTIANNTARYSGGGVFIADGANLISPLRQYDPNEMTYFHAPGATISGNRSLEGSGGGIATGEGGSLLSLSNATISGNHAAGDGGGVRAFHSCELTHCTVVQNRSDSGRGGGIAVDSKFTETFERTIVAYNVGGDCAGDIRDDGDNIVGDGSCLTHPTSFAADPLLGPLADNGGTTLTHALLPGSPAINAALVGECDLEIDQRGVARPQGPACDIGAYEVGECEPASCPAGSTPLIDRDGNFAGWCVLSSHPSRTDIYVDDVVPGNRALIEISQDFNVRAPITLTFQQVCENDAAVVPAIIIADESVTNLTPVDWPDFSWELTGDHVWFDVAASSQFRVSPPFATKVFGDFLDAPENQRAQSLRASDGVVAPYTSFFPGYGTGSLKIVANLAADNAPMTFDLIESSSATRMLGDLDFDGDVDVSDFGLFAQCFGGVAVSRSPACAMCDFDNDADVDTADFAIFARHFTGTR